MAWVAVVFAVAVAGAVAYEHVYDRGVAAEHANTVAAQAELAAMTHRADQADAFDKADAQARADAARYTAALDAARQARCRADAPAVPDAVHRALTGRVTPEDAPLPESFKAAERALRKARGK